MYDITFHQVEIFDGTGAKPYIADVAIKKGKIAEIGCINNPGCPTVDGTGLALSPGFIDVHTHSDSQLFTEPSRLSKLRQGVTFEIGGQCGWSRGPAAPTLTDASLEYLKSAGLLGADFIPQPSYPAMTKSMEEKSLGAHQMSFVGHQILRASVMGMDDREPTKEELETMKSLLEEAMKEGAPGLSTGLVYAPGCYSKLEEVIELAKVVAKYNGIYTSHIRSEADGLLDAVAEVVHVAKEAGVSTNISHMKVMFKKNLPLLDKAIQMIEEANAQGCDISFDVYPYDACSATILSTLPPSYLTHDMDWLINELSSPDGICRLEKAIKESKEDWENPMLNAGFDHDLIAQADITQDAVGKTVHDYGVLKGMSDVEAYAYIIAKNRGSVQDIRFLMFNESIAKLYKHPLCMVGSDGLYDGSGRISHPRAFGTFPRYLGRFIREQKVLSFEEGIRRITGKPADRYRLAGKGYIKPAYDADLVLFNKNTIIDKATYADPFIANEGIEMVLVGGQAAVVKNQPTGAMNGKVFTIK